MNRSIATKFVVAAALAAAALGTASVAQARADVYLTFGIPGRPAYVEPAPVYVRPEPVYVQPRPVYLQPPAYAYERPWQPSYDSELQREREWRRAEWQRRRWQQQHHHEWDRYQPYGRDRY
ncbi:MAG: hypothetical protein ABIX12_08145 [Rubrivivax sp.]